MIILNSFKFKIDKMENICKAPNCNLNRTSNHHCNIHANIFVPKYLKYKKYQNELNINNIDKDVKFLLQLWNKYAKVHKMRTDCMRKYFKPEYWDNGHLEMVNNLWNEMLKIETMIMEKVKEYPEYKSRCY